VTAKTPAGHGGGGRRPADPGRAGEGGPGHPGRLGQGLLQQGRPEAAEPGRDQALQEGRGQRDDDQQRGQPEPAQRQRHRDHDRRRGQGDQLHQADQERGQLGRHPVDELEQVGLDPDHGVLGPDGKGEAAQERGRGHHQPQRVHWRP
jgi:hypothetical protein